MLDIMHNITDIARCAAQFRSEELAPLGLKSCHASYLCVICDHPGITQDQLARRIFINKSNVARQLVILEEDGFVTRRPAPEDKRAMQVFPTAKTLDCLPKLEGIFREWETLVCQDLTQQEQQMMSAMLDKIKIRSAQWMDGR